MIHRTLLPALLISALIAAPVFADEDAGPTDASSGVTATDAGTIAPTDSVSSPDSSTGTTAPFGSNPCWDEKCPKELKACKDNANCVKYNECEKKGDSKCAQDLSTNAPKDVELHAAFKKCGFTACADPNAGSCNKPGKNGAKTRCGQWDDNWPCNCDDACKSYNDCCADRATVCGGSSAGDTCKDKCGKYDQAAKCQCDPDCKKPENGDCCPDYDKLCSGPCKPSCDGKTCGDDGCGGKCGDCTGGAVCDAAGKCVGGQPQVDAGTAVSNDAGANPQADAGSATTDTGTVKTDVAADAGTTPAPTGTPAASSSSSCTASPAGGSAGGLLLVGLALIGLISLRRRFA